jgi:hypothetical protein
MIFFNELESGYYTIWRIASDHENWTAEVLKKTREYLFTSNYGKREP